MLIPFLHQQQTTLINFTLVLSFLKDPTLIIHDETNMTLLEEIIRAMSAKKTIFIGTPNGKIGFKNKIRGRSLILIVKDPSHSISQLRDWRIWSARDPVLVLVEKPDAVHDWLDILWRQLRVINAVVMVVTSQPTYHTWFPYQPKECENVQTIAQLSESNLFPKKNLQNLNGCLIKAASSIMAPFVISENEGVEPLLLKDLTQKVNATLSIDILPQDQNIWQVLNILRVPIGGLRQLWMNEIDIIFGNMQVIYTISLYTDLSTIYSEEAMSIFVPAPLPISKATSVYRTFSLKAWFYILGALLLISLANAFFLYFGENSIPTILLPTTALFLSLPFKIPKNRHFQVFVTITYFYSLHLTTAYESSILVFLFDSPREPAIKSIEELKKKEWKLQVIATYRPIVSNYENLEYFFKKHRMICKPMVSLEEVRDRKNAVMGPRTSFSLLADTKNYFDEDGLPKVIRLSQPMFTFPVCFMMSVGHPLLNTFNKYVRQSFEAGITKFYLSKYRPQPTVAFKYMSPLHADNLTGAFIVLMFGLSTSFFIFMCEQAYDLFNHLKLKRKLAKNHMREQRKRNRIFNLDNINMSLTKFDANCMISWNKNLEVNKIH